jgi:2-dehydro-3-deoxyglucarate aldolase/4-hydroxy-2-oxoheptanedioate aldolase
VAWIGQADMTVSLGIPGQYDHPAFIRAFDKVLNACKKHDVVLGFLPLNMNEATAMIDKGVRCIAYSADVFLFSIALKTSVQQINEYISQKTKGSEEKITPAADKQENKRVIDLGGGRKYYLSR